ncbi:MAG TPA: hypothetical protein DIV79_02045 [Opitutae bacterium]|nr:hypothetical protein [Opitutae bacterium]
MLGQQRLRGNQYRDDRKCACHRSLSSGFPALSRKGCAGLQLGANRNATFRHSLRSSGPLLRLDESESVDHIKEEG